MTTRYFYDTEFLEDGKTIDLISIGIACEDGREYYAVNAAVGDSLNDDDLGKRISRHDWLMANVVPHLPLYQPQKRYDRSGPWMPPFLDMKSTLVRPLWVIANEVREFLLCDIPKGTDVELWADYCAYDHVALAQLWGPMIHLPKGIPMYTNDIQTYARLAGVSHKDLPKATGDEHHALADARNVWDRYTHIRDAQRARTR